MSDNEMIEENKPSEETPSAVLPDISDTDAEVIDAENGDLDLNEAEVLGEEIYDEEFDDFADEPKKVIRRPAAELKADWDKAREAFTHELGLYREMIHNSLLIVENYRKEQKQRNKQNKPQ